MITYQPSLENLALPSPDIGGDSATYAPAGKTGIEDFTMTIDLQRAKYPLQGMFGEYTDPTEPVGLDDWEALDDHP